MESSGMGSEKGILWLLAGGPRLCACSLVSEPNAREALWPDNGCQRGCARQQETHGKHCPKASGRPSRSRVLVHLHPGRRRTRATHQLQGPLSMYKATEVKAKSRSDDSGSDSAAADLPPSFWTKRAATPLGAVWGQDHRPVGCGNRTCGEITSTFNGVVISLVDVA